MKHLKLDANDAPPPSESTAQPVPPKKNLRHTDPTLLMAAKLDRIVCDLPSWGRLWAIRYLAAKWGVECPGPSISGQMVQESPACGT